ncbi:MAG: hypothetical protein AAGC68_10680 [Verrucomicrobiota bacterium]
MDPPLSPHTERLLRCPETGSPLKFIVSAEIPTLKDRFPEGAYTTEDGTRLYPVRNGLPILIVDEVVPRESIEA